MITRPTLPGLYYQREQVRAAASPLRSDVAGFIGRTRRGEAGVAIRVEGWRGFVEQFGPLHPDEPLSYAMRGYFENGGEIAYVVRIAAGLGEPASAQWHVAANTVDTAFTPHQLPVPQGVLDDQSKFDIQISATSSGAWADGLRVGIRYTYDRSFRHSTLKFLVRPQGEPVESFNVPLRQLEPGERLDSPDVNEDLETAVANRSRFIRLRANAAQSFLLLTNPTDVAAPPTSPQSLQWEDVVLKSISPPLNIKSSDVATAYLNAITVLGDQPEVAMVAMPGLEQEDQLDVDRRTMLIRETVAQAAALQDRIVIVDVRRQAEIQSPSDSAIQYVRELRDLIPDSTTMRAHRAAAVYHPWIRVDDPFGGADNPLRAISPSGHVAGVISRTDRERGAYDTPANVSIADMVDVETELDRTDDGLMSTAGINLIRCLPGRGPMLWGGRTLDLSRDGRFLGQRRFIHRLVRVMRRVAEPLVFDTNGPQLWLTLVHTLGTVLLEAFRSGALQGDRPEEAFRIRCEEKTNPFSERELGRVLCELDLALSAPMEFITLRVALSASGQVEVFDQ